jgi:hypothetical protein
MYVLPGFTFSLNVSAYVSRMQITVIVRTFTKASFALSLDDADPGE